MRGFDSIVSNNTVKQVGFPVSELSMGGGIGVTVAVSENSRVEIGELVIRAGDRLAFPQSGVYAMDFTGYYFRPLEPGEEFTIKGPKKS